METIKIIRPNFCDGVLLTTERMDALSHQSFRFSDFLHKDLSDGIISGFEISVEGKNIILKQGMFKYKEQVFLFDKDVIIPCSPTDKITYLKLSLKDTINKLGETTYYFYIGLSEEKTQANEIEFCRFRLQKGARLRYIYDGFDDMITEFDTINLIHCPYAAKGKASLHPAILNRFAAELVKTGTKNILDQNFCIKILADNSTISLESICAYLKFREDIEFEKPTNNRVYKTLNDILWTEKNKVKEIQKKPIQRRMIMVD
ncbi:MAG: hypothetical protein R3Y24_02825 [Eubacteriales bacterium]